MKTKIIQNIKAVILGCVLVLGVGYASAWTAPTEAPTGGDVPAPINVGSSAQEKLGDFTLVRSFIGSLKVTNDFTYATGTPTVGKVLTAIDSTGKVGWGTVSGGGSVNKIIAGTGISVNPASGVGDVTVSAMACNWVGRWGVYGNRGGCGDDVYFTCTNNVISLIEKSPTCTENISSLY